MDNKSGAPKPMLYIVQPDFPRGNLQMQDHFIWRRKNEPVQAIEEIEANEPIAEEKSAPNEGEAVFEKKEAAIEDETPGWNPEPFPAMEEVSGVNEEPLGNLPEKKQKNTIANYFFEQVKEKNIPNVGAITTSAEDTRDEEPVNVKMDFKDENAKKIWRTVTTLARYPHFLRRPTVEAIVAGERMVFQIDSKRGKKLRVKSGDKLKLINIEDISQIEIR